MKAQYLGHSCFVFKSEDGKILLTDPFGNIGYDMPNGTFADVVTVSHGHFDHAHLEGLTYKTCITTVDATCVDGFSVHGAMCYHDDARGTKRGKNIAYVIEKDGITVCHMGDIGEPARKDLADMIGKIDVLCIPVGGNYTVDAVGAKEYIKLLEPKIVLPMHYKTKDSTIAIDGIEKFLSLFEGGEYEIESNVDELAFSFKDGRKRIVVMNRTRGYYDR